MFFENIWNSTSEGYQELNACGYWKKHGGKIIVGSNFPIRDTGLSSILCCGVIKWLQPWGVPKLVQVQPIPTLYRWSVTGDEMILRTESTLFPQIRGFLWNPREPTLTLSYPKCSIRTTHYVMVSLIVGFFCPCVTFNRGRKCVTNRGVLQLTYCQ